MSGNPSRGTVPFNHLGRHTEPVRDRLAGAILRVVNSGHYILGSSVAAFESAFAGYCGVRHCIGCANGTDALELALRACGAGPGRTVITTANAGGYSTSAILSVGAEPRYADIDPTTFLMDPGELKRRIGRDTAAVVVTHLYGRMAEMEAITDIANAAAIPVIEDCAQAHGARRHGRPAGSWGLFGCFSFYPTKNLGALGDAGAVVTSDAAMAERIRALRQYGWHGKYRNAMEGGRNSRLDEMQAAVLLEQLPLLDHWNAQRRRVASSYSEALRDSGLAPAPVSAEDYVAHLYVIRTRERESLRERLAALGIATDVHYPIPDHRQEAWSHRSWAQVELPETERVCAQVLSLPCFPELTDSEVAAVIAAVQESMS